MMKILILSAGTVRKGLLQELKKMLCADGRNKVEQYVLQPSNLQRIQSSGADLVITINLSGFEFTTLTGGISYNLWNTKFVHFLLDRNLSNEGYLNKPLSISMFFYCLGKEYKEYLQENYPNIPYLEEIVGWKKGIDRKTAKVNAEKMVLAIYETTKKCNLPCPLSLAQESEIYFQQLKVELPETKAACQYIDETLDKALNTQDISALSLLIPYIESGKGKLAWKHIGETRRILQILSVIRLEAKYKEPLFCSDCQSKEELTEKYLIMLFALRRLAFCLSKESVKEAEQFLKSANLSPFALHVALQNELIPSDRKFYRRIADLFVEIWNDGRRLLFIQMAEVAGEGSEHG